VDTTRIMTLALGAVLGYWLYDNVLSTLNV
jgi:hypothetical protein